MPNYSFNSPSSPHTPEARNKWTVSPEFGDALLNAMRERRQTGGPLPRLPSLLQLPSAEVKDTPSTKLSPIKSDSAERLKMKTRVAIRDRNPHRFQVVPLRDAGHYSSKDQPPSRDLKLPAGMTDRSTGTARLNPHLWKKARADENTVSTSTEAYTKNDTPERIKTLSERNTNVPKSPSFQLPGRVPLETTLTHNVLLPLDNRPIPENNTQLNEPVDYSSLRTRNGSDRRTLYIKSPSLGNLRIKPNLDSDATSLPHVPCRKRTNTLSADHRLRSGHASALDVDTTVQPNRRNLAKESMKRHAIYTQSLYVPFKECSSLVPDNNSKQPFDRSSPLHAFPSRSSIPSSRNKPDSPSRRRAPTTSALGFINIPAGPLQRSFGSQSSISSVYSQDELSLSSQAALIHTRPLARLGPPSDVGQVAKNSKMDEAPIRYHPIVLKLLVDVEKAMQEWCAI